MAGGGVGAGFVRDQSIGKITMLTIDWSTTKTSIEGNKLEQLHVSSVSITQTKLTMLCSAIRYSTRLSTAEDGTAQSFERNRSNTSLKSIRLSSNNLDGAVCSLHPIGADMRHIVPPSLAQPALTHAGYISSHIHRCVP